MGHHFDFENLDVYQLAVRVARWARSVKWPEDAGKLRDECIRAADSVLHSRRSPRPRRQRERALRDALVMAMDRRWPREPDPTAPAGPAPRR